MSVRRCARHCMPWGSLTSRRGRFIPILRDRRCFAGTSVPWRWMRCPVVRRRQTSRSGSRTKRGLARRACCRGAWRARASAFFGISATPVSSLPPVPRTRSVTSATAPIPMRWTATSPTSRRRSRPDAMVSLSSTVPAGTAQTISTFRRICPCCTCRSQPKPIENLFGFLKSNSLANRVFATVDDVCAAIADARNALLADPDRISSSQPERGQNAPRKFPARRQDSTGKDFPGLAYLGDLAEAGKGEYIWTGGSFGLTIPQAPVR